MNYLIDTHVLIWWDLERSTLSPAVAAILSDARNTIWVSVATVWEIAIKRGVGRLEFDGSIRARVDANGFALLPIEAADAEAAGALPLHHGDPFDRMLVAQADRRGMVLVTADRVLAVYGVAMLSAR